MCRGTVTDNLILSIFYCCLFNTCHLLVFCFLFVQVLVGPECSHGSQRAKQVEVTCTPDPDFLLLERWTVTCAPKK